MESTEVHEQRGFEVMPLPEVGAFRPEAGACSAQSGPSRRLERFLHAPDEAATELSTDMDHSVADDVDPLKEQKVSFAPPEKGVAVPDAVTCRSTRRSQPIAYASF